MGLQQRPIILALGLLLTLGSVAGLAVPGCGSGSDGDADSDADTDTDADSDVDTDADSDTDADTDTDCTSIADCEMGELCLDRRCVTGCNSSRDCPPDRPRCDPERGAHGECVACLADTDCGGVQICREGECTMYCVVDGDCNSLADRPHCDGALGICVACTSTTHCELGNLCVDGGCTPGCNSSRDCPAGLSCRRDLGEHGRCVEAGDSDSDTDLDTDTDTDADSDTDADTDTDTGTPAGLSIQLTWDREVDLDLHLLRGTGHDAVGSPGDPTGACPSGTGADCHWKNACPDWGITGDGSDDPALVIDSVAGPGPEQISFPQPGPGTYTVVIHYFPSVTAPEASTRATVTLRGGARAADTEVYGQLEGKDRCWDALEIEYPAGTSRPLTGSSYPCELP